MEDFVTYKQALKLKELGFDWECNHFYDGKFSNELLDLSYYHNFNDNGAPQDCSAPTLAQVQKWLREVKGIFVYSKITSQPELKGKHYWEITSKNGEILNIVPYGKLVDSYEQALSNGIDEALELLKEENNGK